MVSGRLVIGSALPACLTWAESGETESVANRAKLRTRVARSRTCVVRLTVRLLDRGRRGGKGNLRAGDCCRQHQFGAGRGFTLGMRTGTAVGAGIPVRV